LNEKKEEESKMMGLKKQTQDRYCMWLYEYEILKQLGKSLGYCVLMK
jgi:hypothetical protein